MGARSQGLAFSDSKYAGDWIGGDLSDKGSLCPITCRNCRISFSFASAIRIISAAFFSQEQNSPRYGGSATGPPSEAASNLRLFRAKCYWRWGATYLVKPHLCLGDYQHLLMWLHLWHGNVLFSSLSMTSR